MLVVLVAMHLSGCATYGASKKNCDYQGKVWRSKIVVPLMNTLLVEKEGATTAYAEFFKATAFFSRELAYGMRLANYSFQEGSKYFRFGAALIPDSIDVADLKKGALVDVLVEKGSDANFATRRITRIVRLVCRADDKECLSKEASRGIIDDNPGDGSKYKVTFDKKITQEDLTNYLFVPK